VSVGPTRATAPWKCSSSISPIGVGQRAKPSIMARIASSLSAARKLDFQ
jgi:hypothetical protein